MTKALWDEQLSNFGNVIFGKIDKDNEMNTDEDSQSKHGGANDDSNNENNDPQNIKIDINMSVKIDVSIKEIIMCFKRANTELTNKQDYKKINTLFGRYLNASKFNTNTLYEVFLNNINDLPNEMGKSAM